MGIENWNDIVHDREKWRGIVVTTKTLRVDLPSEKEEKFYLLLIGQDK